MADLRKGYWVEILPVVRHDGSCALTFIAKRTFRVPEAALVVEPLEDDAQPPLLAEDRFDDGDATTAAPTLEYDLVPEKAGVDVLVVGKTYAPGGKPLETWDAKLRLGRVIRSLRVVGPRVLQWQPPQKRQGEMIGQPPRISPPAKVKEVALTLANAYGGKTRVIPDPAELPVIRTVQGEMAKEQAEDDAKRAKAQELKAEAAKKAEAEAARDAILKAPMTGDEDEKGLRRARGEFGYDKEGVRLHGVATSQRGTAVMDLDTFAKWQQAQADKAAKVSADAAKADPEAQRRDRLRRNADGEVLEVDDGVEIVDPAKLAKELARAKEEQAAWRAEWAKAARKRKREQVQSNDGTQMLDVGALGLDGDDDDDKAADAAWEAKLRADLEVADAERRVALRKELEAARKEREEKLKEFPELPCPTNPFGKGFVVSNVRDVVDGLELPLLEDPDAPLTAADIIRSVERLDAVPLPAGFSTWPRSARPRIDKAGAYPADIASFDHVVKAQQRALDLDNPDDVAAAREYDRKQPPKAIEPGFFNSAPPWLQLAKVVGDEDVELDNLSKTGHLVFKLPGRAVLAELDRGRGVERAEMAIDTVIIEPDQRTVSLVWRTHYPISGFDELGTYPQLVGWVLDLDVKDKRAADWADAAAKAKGDGTAVIDIAELEKMERGDGYWRTISDERLAAEAEAARHDGTAALDLARMGLYRQVDDSAWENEVAAGVVDESALKREQQQEEAFLAAKQNAVAALEEKEKADAIRREEIAAAAKDGKPIPPPDSKKTPKQLAEAQKARAEAQKAKESAKPAQAAKPAPDAADSGADHGSKSGGKAGGKAGAKGGGKG